MARFILCLIAGALSLSACTSAALTADPPEPAPDGASPTAPASAASPAASPAPTPSPQAAPSTAPVAIPYRIETRTDDAATADFAEIVRATLEDPRGWQQAGFDFVEAPGAEHVVVLGEGADVDALCLPYDTYGEYSCQNGPVVALNADRWRIGTPEWTGDLATYRMMLVNHEVGHLVGRRHVDCETPGELAPIMVQQSTELEGCLANPWPLPDEIELAARHDQPIAPGYGE